MKLIVDISEEDYKECKFRKDLLFLEEPTELTFNMRMETLIANGIPLEKGLEKIKAEINEQRLFNKSLLCKSDLHHAINIINKHISELKGE